MSQHPDSAQRRRQVRRPVSPILRHAYVAILALWIVMPIALTGRVAQDAIPYVTAGRLAQAHPDMVYAARNGDLFDLPPTFAREWCRIAPSGTDCDSLAVAFVAAPPVIPLAVLLGQLGGRVGTLVMQLASAAMLAGGMWVLWRRLAHRTRRAPMMLVITAMGLTPMAMGPIGLGQTSPILFLSVCLGLDRITGRDASAQDTDATTSSRSTRSIIWALAVGLKVFPVALGAILLWRRRRRMLIEAIVVLSVGAVGALLLTDAGVWSDFLRSTLDLNAHTTTNPYNGAVNAFVIRLFGSSDSPAVALVARAVAFAAAGIVCWFGLRRTDDDTRWAAGYLALLLVTPLVWWHYTWVVIGALGVAVAAHKRLDDRTVAVLPIAGLISAIPSIPNANGHSWPMVQGALLLAGAAAFCVLARRSASVRNSAAG